MLQPIAFYPNPTTGLTNKKDGKVRQGEEGFRIQKQHSP